MSRTKKLTVGQVVYALLSIGFLIFSAVSYRMGQEKYSKAPMFSDPLIFYGVFAGVALLGLVVILLGHFSFHVRPSWVLLGLLTVLFVGNSVALASETLTGTTFGLMTFRFATEEKVRFALCFFLTIETLYFLIGVLPHFGKGSYVWTFALLGIVIGVMVMCVYSFIVEWKVYASVLSGGTLSAGNCTRSFTGLRNYWGMALMLGFFAAIIGHSRTHSFFWFIPILTFLFAVFFTMAKSETTAILLSGLGYTLYVIIHDWKKYRFTAIFCLVFLLMMLTFLGLVMFSPGIPFLAAFQRFYDYMINDMSAGSPMNGRDKVFADFIKMIRHQPSANWFGFGNYLPNYVLSFSKRHYDWYHCHNAWLELMSHGGIIRLGIVGGGLCYFLFLVFKGVVKRRQWEYFAVFASITGYAVFSVAEFVMPADNDVWGILTFIVLIMPVLHDEAMAKKGLLNEVPSIDEMTVKPRRIGLFDLLIAVTIAGFFAAFASSSWAFALVALTLDLLLILIAAREGKAWQVGVYVPISFLGFYIPGAVFGSGFVPLLITSCIGFSVCCGYLYALKAYLGEAESYALYYLEAFCVKNHRFLQDGKEGKRKVRFF